MRQPIGRIYGQLGDYLTERGGAGECRVILTFAQVEAILHAWYGWHRVGWRVETVTFLSLSIPADDQATCSPLAADGAGPSGTRRA